MILNNTANKVFMRNTDVKTRDTLQSILPTPPTNNQHIITARPLTTLDVGEAYYLLAARYEKWLVELFNEDRVIDNLEAWCLNLVDEINELTPTDHTLAQTTQPMPDPVRQHTASKMAC